MADADCKWTASPHHRQSYGKWGGNPRGTPVDVSRCAESVSSSDRGSIPHQCRKARGYGPDAAFCKQHDPAEVAKRSAASAKAYDSKRREESLLHFRFVGGGKLIEALQSIADGNNDPRTLARETLDAWRKSMGERDV